MPNSKTFNSPKQIQHRQKWRNMLFRPREEANEYAFFNSRVKTLKDMSPEQKAEMEKLYCGPSRILQNNQRS